MTLRYFWDGMSQPARAVLIFLKTTGIPSQQIKIDLRNGDNMTPEFTKINPFQKVPAMDHNGFCLSESIAMIRYLTREFQDKIEPHWYPQDPKLRARIDEYLSWQHLNIRAYAGLYFRYSFLFPQKNKVDPDPKQVQKAGKDLNNVLDVMENVWLGNGKYITGSDEITIADIFAICELEQPAISGFNVEEGRPKIAAYRKLVKERLNPIYDEVNTVLYKVIERNRERMKARASQK